MKRIVNWDNYVSRHLVYPDLDGTYSKGELSSNPIIGEVNNLPSKTVPDQALSLSEMLNRYVRGGDVEVFTPLYSEDFPNVERMSELDRLDLAREMKSELQSTTDAIKKIATDRRTQSMIEKDAIPPLDPPKAV